MAEQLNVKLPFSKAEAKNDTTTRVAKEIIDGEVAARDAKTDRLRAARLAREAADEAAAEAAPKKSASRTAGAKRSTAVRAASPKPSAKPKAAKRKSAEA